MRFYRGSFRGKENGEKNKDGQLRLHERPCLPMGRVEASVHRLLR